MATARSSSGPLAEASPATTAEIDPQEETHLHLRLSPEMARVIEGLAIRASLPKEDVLNMAVGFLQAAAEAIDEGKRVGIAGEGQPLEVEFKGL